MNNGTNDGTSDDRELAKFILQRMGSEDKMALFHSARTSISRALRRLLEQKGVKFDPLVHPEDVIASSFVSSAGSSTESSAASVPQLPETLENLKSEIAAFFTDLKMVERPPYSVQASDIDAREYLALYEKHEQNIQFIAMNLLKHLRAARS